MGDLLARNLKKQSARAKEKLMESLGKADRTTDEEFDDHCNNFSRQQKSAERLHKELKNYVQCVKAMAAASKGFQEALRETYEPEWPGMEHVRAMSQSIELVWEDYCEKLTDQALNPLSSYSSQFPDVKAKIAKRGRKLVDFDVARHNLETMKTGGKAASEAKLQKCQEQFTVAKRYYDDLNQELMEELPALYDSRITFYVNNFQTVFNLEQNFHQETSKLSRELCVQFDELGHSLGRLRVPRKSSNNSPATKKSSLKGGGDTTPNRSEAQSLAGSAKSTPQSAAKSRSGAASEDSVSSQGKEAPSGAVPLEKRNGEPARNPFDSDGGSSASASASAERRGSRDSVESTGGEAPPAGVNERAVDVLAPAPQPEPEPSEQPPEDANEKQEPAPVAAEPAGEAEQPAPAPPAEPAKKGPETAPPPSSAPSDVQGKVRATHRYTAEDVDELSFEAGEVIQVIPYEDPEEQDEGWLMGLKLSGEKGVFPANFTKPV